MESMHFPIDCGNLYKISVTANTYESVNVDIDTRTFDTPDIVKNFALDRPADEFTVISGGGAEGEKKGDSLFAQNKTDILRFG